MICNCGKSMPEGHAEGKALRRSREKNGEDNVELFGRKANPPCMTIMGEISSIWGRSEMTYFYIATNVSKALTSTFHYVFGVKASTILADQHFFPHVLYMYKGFDCLLDTHQAR